jgi:hypothetical protein
MLYSWWSQRVQTHQRIRKVMKSHTTPIVDCVREPASNRDIINADAIEIKLKAARNERERIL